MSHDTPSPLRLQPPSRTADEALGERLALLARASTPTPVRRRLAWRAPLAAVVVVAGTGGIAFGTQAVVHHIRTPAVVVPGGDLAPSADPSAHSDSPVPTASTPARSTSGTTPKPGQENRGKHVGEGHAHGPGSAPGHTGANPGKHLAKGASRGKKTGQQKQPGRGHAAGQHTNAGKHRGNGG